MRRTQVADLGKRQKMVLEYILDAVETRGYPPSVREIGEAVGLSSPSTVHAHLKSLSVKGYLKIDPSKPRAISISYARELGPVNARPEVRHVPLVGRVAAGSPSLAIEEVEEVIAIPTRITKEGNLFVLEIKGDSMIDAGIHNGDLVVVKEQSVASNGDVVIALLGEDATCKVFTQRNGKVTFEARNAAYPHLAATQDSKILGKVVGLMRSL